MIRRPNVPANITLTMPDGNRTVRGYVGSDHEIPGYIVFSTPRATYTLTRDQAMAVATGIADALDGETR